MWQSLPPRPDPHTGEPRPPRAPGFRMPQRPSKELDRSRETRVSRKPSPPPGQGPVLVWFSHTQRKAFVEAAGWFIAFSIFCVAYAGFTYGSKGLTMLSSPANWWILLIPVVIALVVYGIKRKNAAAAGADWVNQGKAWVCTYELTKIRARTHATGVHLDLQDGAGRTLGVPLDDIQRDRDMWDLVYNGMLHSVTLYPVDIDDESRRILDLPRSAGT